jgi:hypothetical protein
MLHPSQMVFCDLSLRLDLVHSDAKCGVAWLGIIHYGGAKLLARNLLQ